MNLCASVLERK